MFNLPIARKHPYGAKEENWNGLKQKRRNGHMILREKRISVAKARSNCRWAKYSRTPGG